MIKLDISFALFFYFLFTVVLVFILWIYIDRRPGFTAFKINHENIWQCSICSYVYIDTRGEDFSRCPRCKNLNEKNRQKAPACPRLRREASRQGRLKAHEGGVKAV